MIGHCITWRDRLCGIDNDGTWYMSAVGEHFNFDVSPVKSHCGQAVAGSLPGDGTRMGGRGAVRMAVVDDERLVMVADDGSIWLLTGDPMAKGRFDRLVIEKPPTE